MRVRVKTNRGANKCEGYDALLTTFKKSQLKGMQISKGYCLSIFSTESREDLVYGDNVYSFEEALNNPNKCLNVLMISNYAMLVVDK